MNKNYVIALLTDFGDRDGFVGTMKGVIYGINRDATIVDLSHNVSPQNIREGAFILNSSRKYFPSFTVFLVVVDPGVGSDRRAIILRTSDAFYVAPDNGVLSSIFREEKVLDIIEINNRDYFLSDVSNTFHGRDIFAPVAAYLSKGIEPLTIGSKINTMSLLKDDTPCFDSSNRILCNVIYIDKFGNLITNLSKVFLAKHGLKIEKVCIKDLKIEKLSKSYSESSTGDALSLMGSSGYMEIALNQGNASKELGCFVGEEVYIEILKGN